MGIITRARQLSPEAVSAAQGCGVNFDIGCLPQSRDLEMCCINHLKTNSCVECFLLVLHNSKGWTAKPCVLLKL